MNEQVFKSIPASVADAENRERGQYVAKGPQHPIMEHWGGFLYILQNLENSKEK